MFVEILSIFGVIVGFCLVTLAIASGLFYLSEIIEENTEVTNRFLKRVLKSLSVLLVLLYLFDSFPLSLTLLTLISYYIYYQNLKTFPYIKVGGPIFITSCVLVALNHYLWFRHFSNPVIPSIEERLKPDFKMPKYLNFTEIASFFGICIWFVPFALFISVSASDNSLPFNNADLKRFDGDSSTISGSQGVGINENMNKVGKRSVNLFKYLISALIQRVEALFAVLGLNLKLTNRDTRNPNEMYI